ncbi:hypothetical protein KIMH_00620 [Bombiscardovia apis]|uniref:RCC1-like domain-containing protein n=1 Tax=Bombiscardovia apis TaxID=2932182 RepID=A0ABM8BAL0_9BIFI|nr:InlB B-repeat-containing protein [Bombiscardovia apis]BDR53951.1 hypothetical protein KIMH_00620 [Bombiscardovia apis]
MGGGALHLVKPTSADPPNQSQGFSITPKSGPANSNNPVTINPPHAIAGVRFTVVSALSNHALALGSDGNAYAWGSNAVGQLGNGTNISSTKPVMVQTPAGVRFTKISAGWEHSVALGDDGNAYAWGINSRGQLGTSSLRSSNRPVKVSPPAYTRFTDVMAGGWHSFATCSNGSTYGWGHNLEGELGAGTNIDANYNLVRVLAPANVSFVNFSTGWDHTIAVGSDGNTYAWGYNATGQLGTSAGNKNVPTRVTGIPSGVRFTSVSAGNSHSLAIGSDSNTYAWGDNSWGQLGIGTSSGTYRTPRKVTPAPGGYVFTSISAGNNHSLAIGWDKKVYAWGTNTYGQLGTGNTSSSYKPTMVDTNGVDIVQVSASTGNGSTSMTGTSNFGYSLGVDKYGNTYAWGNNQYGQLGTGTSSFREIKLARVGGNIAVTSVTFDGMAGTKVSSNDVIGLWNGKTPLHRPGKVEVIVQWTLNGVTQQAAKLNYRFLDRFTVQFDTGGAPISKPANQSLNEGSQVVWPSPTPAWPGHNFAGWFTDNGTPWNFDSPITQNLNLTARWDSVAFSLNPTTGSRKGNTAVTITANPNQSKIRFVQIAAGSNFTIGLGSNGLVYAWGANDRGQLGDGSNSDHSTPTVVHLPAGTTFSSIAVGDKHALAIGRDNKVYAWGANDKGQLGNGAYNDCSTPVVFATPQGANPAKVAAGSQHSLALMKDGTIYAAGMNSKGQLGDQSLITRANPVKTYYSDSLGFTQIAAGKEHSLAITDDNEVYAWGANDNGQLGIAGTNQLTPQNVTGLSTRDITQVVGGDNYSAALDESGQIYTWGNNSAGQLGNGTNTNTSTPIAISLPGNMKAKSISAGSSHMLALTNAHTIYAWGANTNGQLGIGSTNGSNSPIASAAPNSVTFSTIEAGNSHGLATSTTGEAYAWGLNSNGQLGDGSTTQHQNPTPGSGLLITITAAKFDQANATGNMSGVGTWSGTTPAHSPGTVPVNIEWNLAGETQPAQTLSYTYERGTIYVIRFNLGGAPGNAPADQTFEEGEGKHATWPTPPTRAGYEFAGWFTGGQPFDFTTPVRASANLTARWDVSEFKLTPQAGRVTGGTHLTLTGPGQPGFKFTQVCAGSDYSVALGSNGLIYAWGNNSSNQLGDESTVTRRAPVRVHTPVGVTFTSIAASPKSDYTMAVGSDGKAYAWGSNRYGLLSNGGNRDNTKPEEYILPAGVKAVEVAAGIRHSLVLSQDGKVYATGVNYYGEVANNTNVNTYYTAIPVSLPAGKTFVHIAAGEYFSLALSSDGQLYSWGYNNNGRLGDGDITEHADPRPVSLPPGVSFTQIAAQHDYAAAIGDDNNVYTWGSNVKGQLGTGDTTPRRKPTKITLPGSAKAASVATGESHTLALTTTGSAYAWGNDWYGQLGTGNSVDQLSPTPLSGVGNNTFTTISAGYDHSLAVNTAGDMYAWGSSADGRLGDGTFYNKNEPSPVTKLTNNVTGFDLGGTAVTGFSSTGSSSWKADSAAHADGKVDVEIHWSKAGEEQTYTITKGYEYYTFAKLAKAGALPAKRRAGLTLIASSSCLAGCYIIMRKRQGAGRHVMR